MALKRSAFYDDIRRFLLSSDTQAAAELGDTPIGEDDNLFDLGLVTSFSALGMIVHIEDLLGESIDVSALEMETFYTLRSLYDALVHKQSEHAAP